MKCVVFIGTAKEAESGVFRATGFLCYIPFNTSSQQGFYYLVTARHVASRADQGLVLRINLTDGTSALVNLADLKWFFHPTDESIDIAIAEFSMKPEFEIAHVDHRILLDSKQLEHLDVGVGSEVYIPGLFSYHVGEERNLPILRTGTIALLNRELVKSANSRVEGYLIEARSTGGLSGSPVFAASHRDGETRVHVIGLIHGHWDIPVKSSDPVEYKEFIEKVNSGISIVVPAARILEALHQKTIVQERIETEKRESIKDVLEAPPVIEG